MDQTPDSFGIMPWIRSKAEYFNTLAPYFQVINIKSAKGKQ